MLEGWFQNPKVVEPCKDHWLYLVRSWAFPSGEERLHCVQGRIFEHHFPELHGDTPNGSAELSSGQSARHLGYAACVALMDNGGFGHFPSLR